MTISGISEKIKGPISLNCGPATSLILAGPDTEIHGLDLTGDLVIDDPSVAKKPLDVANPGWRIEPIDDLVNATAIQPAAATAIRGFRIVKVDDLHLRIAGS